MYNYSIMSVDNGTPEDIAADILRLYRDNIADLALMNMTLVPEGQPPFDKAGMLCEKYDIIRDILEKQGAKLGILVQASVGHGWKLNHMHPFQNYVKLSDGTSLQSVCPLDPNFRQFFYGQMKTVASHRPSIIMVDDDFRLLNKGGGRGCACPRHMALFNERAGMNLTREQLYNLVRTDSEEGRRAAKIFTETQRDALLGAATVYREAIDAVDPTIPGIYCCVAGEFAGEIARILAGKGNPVIVRLNNGNYTAAGARFFTRNMLRAAFQIATMNGHVDAFLAETDTCPQNRYSTGTQQLHSHFTGTLLEGASGAKHWITRLHAWEPNSGEAYRKLLSKYYGFYCEVSRLAAIAKPVGCRVPLPSEWRYDFNSGTNMPSAAFATCVLERFGLPLYFSKENGGVAFLDGTEDENFSNDEIRVMLSGKLVLSASCADRLIKRGFGEYLGVTVKPWNGVHTSGEILPNGNSCSAQVSAMELTPISDDVRVDSTTYHLYDGKDIMPLFAGVTVYDNSLGGRVIVFCGTPNTAYNITEAFSFLNESRKAQFMKLIADCGELPVCYTGDAELYLRAAKLPDNSYMTTFFEISLDHLEDLPISTDFKVTSIECLLPDGQRQKCEFTQTEKDGRYELSVIVDVYPLNPVVLFLAQ